MKAIDHHLQAALTRFHWRGEARTVDTGVGGDANPDHPRVRTRDSTRTGKHHVLRDNGRRRFAEGLRARR